MLIDCLKWRIQNQIDDIQLKPIDTHMYTSIRESQLVGISGCSKEGIPVIAIGVGLSTYDKASFHYHVQSHLQINEYRDRVILLSATKKYGRYIGTCIEILDMTGLKLSALSQIKLYNNIKEQSAQVTLPVPIKQSSFHVDFPEPDPEDVKIAQTKKMSFKESVTKTGFPTHYTSLA